MTGLAPTSPGVFGAGYGVTLTLSSTLTYGGVTLSPAVTGTGAMVLAGSPTFLGTVSINAAHFSSNVKFTGGTGTPGANGEAFVGGEADYGYRFTGKGSVYDMRCDNSALQPVWLVPTGTQTLALSGSLYLGSAAVTGLTPGVLAAQTNASIVICDSNGQAYRIPCII